MRKVFEHPASHEVGHFESILKSHGIDAVIRNQNVSSLVGEVPFTAAYLELWILDDADYDRAIALLTDYRRTISQDMGEEWILSKLQGDSARDVFLMLELRICVEW